MAYVGNPGYVAVSITLADTNAHQLLTLITAIVPAMSTTTQNCSALAIQADTINGANAVYIGDASVSTTRYGYALLAHDQYVYHSPVNTNVPLSQIYVLGQAASVQINVEVWFV